MVFDAFYLVLWWFIDFQKQSVAFHPIDRHVAGANRWGELFVAQTLEMTAKVIERHCQTGGRRTRGTAWFFKM
jgi:hypothetical protein